jgi:pyruvate/2-oxoglutarate dehydrogenase complex dihydrolipoamide acyltransferase (E2) component
MSDVSTIVVPQLNANDETVRLVEWLVSHGQKVSAGDAICEVETSKAVTELVAEQSGIIYHVAASATDVRVGETIGAVGPSLEEVQVFLEAAKETRSETVVVVATSGSYQPDFPATPRARVLADELGVSLPDVGAAGVRGTIKESDVRRYASEHGPSKASSRPVTPASLPPAYARYIVEEGPLSQHKKSVASALRHSRDLSITATIDAEIDLSQINPNIQEAQEQGSMVSLLHVALKALGITLPHFPQLASFHLNDLVYRYRELDIAFAVKSLKGDLYAPVIRTVDQLDVKQIARACYTAAVEANRGRMSLASLEGACFTVSHLPVKPVARFLALPNQFQSAILAIAAERTVVKWVNGAAAPAPVATMTLTYDHTLCDGMYAAEFMQRLTDEMASALL